MHSCQNYEHLLIMHNVINDDTRSYSQDSQFPLPSLNEISILIIERSPPPLVHLDKNCRIFLKFTADTLRFNFRFPSSPAVNLSFG